MTMPSEGLPAEGMAGAAPGGSISDARAGGALADDAASADASVEVVHAAVTSEPLDEAAARAAVDAADAGAVVLFSGVVRNHDDGRGVTRLTYTAHPTAEATLRGVVETVIAEHGQAHGASERAMRVWIAHRIGELAVGDAAFVCAVSAAHRGEAFRLCSDLVDRVKAEVPVWKEQFFEGGGSEWVAALG
ncbi:molybdenum cofactor biosynthesis protein MoaE [Sinomonas sp. ASV486]|uniref:molybdenum cofactor biosynthesis protein MoaE n=1 Tax=Sinomonas sp. ASV486 TaxID=3051170 RepID=UPI0027DEA6F9|nr:molybdenum cofactor biosynthesis protein MoaE [Sinomonas sp. ASV486]MDQ4492138.1 molybdenum cofactor biosynthesis protein MoaE [Sinomonas sp. ASV486]